EIAKSSELQETLRQNEIPTQQAKGIKLVRASEFDQLALPETTLQLITVRDFEASLPGIETLVKENNQVNPELKDYQAMSGQKYEMYQQVNGIFSGMEFMGFFLGIAFLA
ncbi:hypothetical protein NON27_26045, partial [Vibrio parahaemolyticus]|nr:hypothetical protein [Vibrio parahaemolyticus]